MSVTYDFLRKAPSYLSLAFGKVAAFIVRVVMARVLSPEAFGVFSFINALSALASAVTTLGFNKAFLKEFNSSLDAGNDTAKLSITVAACGIVSIVSGALCYLIFEVSAQVRDAMSYSLFSLFLLVCSQALSALMAGVLLANGRANSFVFSTQALVQFWFLILIFGHDALDQLTLDSAIYSLVIANVLTFLVSFQLSFGRYVMPVSWKSSISLPTSNFFRYSAVLLASTVSYIALGLVDKIMLGVLGEAKELAAYSVVFSLASLMSLVLVVVDASFSARIAKAFSGRDLDLVKELYDKSNIQLLNLSLVAVAVFSVFGEFALGLFGPHYTNFYYALLLLFFTELVNVLFGMTGRLMQLSGHHRFDARLVFYFLAFNVVLNYLLIPTYGLDGAIISTVVTRILHGLFKAGFIHRKFGFFPWNISRPQATVPVSLIILITLEIVLR